MPQLRSRILVEWWGKKGPMTNSLDQTKSNSFVITLFPTLILSPDSSIYQETHFNEKNVVKKLVLNEW